MIDLEKLQKRFDEFLNNETAESFQKWLDERSPPIHPEEPEGQEEKLKAAYYAGFNQAHYSILHPELYKGENVECVAACEKWYANTYLK